MSDVVPFKKCPMCSRQWRGREEFITDPCIELTGYMADFVSMENGLFCFTHHTDECGTTMGLKAKAFLDLYPGVRYLERKNGSKVCTRRCLDYNNLEQCDAKCEYAAVREVMLIIRTQKLQQAQAA